MVIVTSKIDQLIMEIGITDNHQQIATHTIGRHL
ncbi:MAG: hypothetical protein ACI8WB_005228, partial [Phenylobacterium sp.]